MAYELLNAQGGTRLGTTPVESPPSLMNFLLDRGKFRVAIGAGNFALTQTRTDSFYEIIIEHQGI